MSDIKANFATDRQRYKYDDGSVWEFYVKVNFDEIVSALGRRARKSKRFAATALGGAVKITAQLIEKGAGR